MLQRTPRAAAPPAPRAVFAHRAQALRAPVARPHAHAPRGRVVLSVGMPPEQMTEEQKAMLEEALKDPAKAAAIKAQAEAYQKALQSPQAQAQLAEMTSFMTNPEIQKKMAALQTDPEFKDFFEAIKTGGPAALMKFWNDDALLAKISAKLGGAGMGMGPSGGAARQAPPQAPPAEVTNLFEAARWGDLEAVEDFISIGKGINDSDKEGRTPLHFAVAFGREETGVAIAQALIAAGAKPDAVDAKRNSTLHYAAGYGRPEYVAMLLDAGADVAARNDTGKTPLDLVKLNSANPVNLDPVVKRLGGGSFFADV